MRAVSVGGFGTGRIVADATPGPQPDVFVEISNGRLRTTRPTGGLAMRIPTLGVIALVSLLFTGCAAATKLTPLPFDARVEAPASTAVPPDIAAFAGVWTGFWSGGVDHTLLVETIERQGNVYRVSAVYSWGAHEASQLRPGFQRVTGTIDGHVLRLARFGNGAQPTYRLHGGVLHGSYWPAANPGYETTAVLRRAPLSPESPGALPALKEPVRSAIAAPVPPDTTIIPPGGSVPPRDHALVVESIEPSAAGWRAMVVYSWGPGAGNNSPPGFQRLAGRITEDGVLHVPLGPSTAMYRAQGRSNSIEGQWVPETGSALFGLFRRDGAAPPRRQ
jgi:hypothetical protein